MSDFQVPVAVNEPVLSYEPGSPERETLKAELERMSSQQIEIPLIIGGKEVRTGDMAEQVIPHRHGHVLATNHKAGKKEVQQAIDAAARAHKDWSMWPLHERAAVFLRAAELLATTWRQVANASTMLNQSKTAFQAEIDAACELIDFFRFNIEYAQRIYEEQPISDPGMWNRIEYRALEGFIYAISPFNFTSIGGNLATAPAIMGGTSIWKPAGSTVFSNYYMMKLLMAAGLPDGVVNFIPGNSSAVSEVALTHRNLAGIHFTGSTEVFQMMWRTVGENIQHYASYPRLVGETGGKDFLIAHPSADRAGVLTAILRGGFEYQGQKCSALSRAYLPASMWKDVKDELIAGVNGIAMGDVADFRNFMGAVIDKKAFTKITGYIAHAKSSNDAEVIAGGESDDSEGYFIHPTLILAKKADYQSMCDEIFGPVVTLYIYDDKDWEQALDYVDTASPYALTGAVFAQDRAAINQAEKKLRYSAGNFYINDKPSGAVVGQQPFGGARASGTNDKAGSMMNLLRWVSARTLKETFVPPTDYRYPYMEDVES